MLSLHSLLITALILILLVWLSFKATNAQNTVAQCGPNLMSLAPCAPFVQGNAVSPVKPCCDNLKQLYSQNPTCLCLLLNDTNLGSFPINTTLAFQLPLLCSINMDSSTCGGTYLQPVSPPTQISNGTQPNSTVAVSPVPVVTVTPRPNIMGFRFHHNAQVKLKAEGQFLIMLLLAAIFQF